MHISMWAASSISISRFILVRDSRFRNLRNIDMKSPPQGAKYCPFRNLCKHQESVPHLFLATCHLPEAAADESPLSVDRLVDTEGVDRIYARSAHRRNQARHQRN